MDLSSFLNNVHAFRNKASLFDDDGDRNGRVPLFFLQSGYAVEYFMINGERKVVRFVEADPEDIASYLNLSLEQYNRLIITD